MTVTAYPGPIVQYGITLSSTSGDGLTGQDMEHNPQRSPTMADLGDAMLDPRSAYNYDPGGTNTALNYAFGNNQGVVDYIPFTASSVAFVLNTASSATSTFTLAAASTANGTILTQILAPETGKLTGNLLAVDSTAAYLVQANTFQSPFVIWNPAGGTGRNVTIFPSSNTDAGTYTVAGRDAYGYKMTESITAGSTNLAGKKAFKYISSITNTTTPVSTGITIGFGNVFGLPMAVTYAGLNLGLYTSSTPFGTAAAAVQSSANLALASTATTQTSTTPDVRGTWTSSLAAVTGSVRVQIYVTPTAASIATIAPTNFTGLFGATQFSSV